MNLLLYSYTSQMIYFGTKRATILETSTLKNFNGSIQINFALWDPWMNIFCYAIAPLKN